MVLMPNIICLYPVSKTVDFRVDHFEVKLQIGAIRPLTSFFAIKPI